MSKRKTKPVFLPDLTKPTHKDLQIQQAKRQVNQIKQARQTKEGERSERVSSDTPPAIDETEFKVLQASHKTKSAMIRNLAARNLKINMIAHTLLFFGVLSPQSAYQHVYNVLHQPLKRIPKDPASSNNEEANGEDN